MIQYCKSSVHIAETHFDETLPAKPEVDVLRYQWRFEKVPGAFSFPLQTRFINLEQDPDMLLGQMSSTTRNEIRRSMKEPYTATVDVRPTDSALDDFCHFYGVFAQSMQLAPANRARLGSMLSSGRLVLSRVTGAEDQTLAWHCYLRHDRIARILHSASLYRANPGKELVRVISRGNRYLHWCDMLALRDQGVSTYDFGGWYTGQSDSGLLGVNHFKESFGGRVVDLYNTYEGMTIKGRLAVQLHRWRGGE